MNVLRSSGVTCAQLEGSEQEMKHVEMLALLFPKWLYTASNPNNDTEMVLIISEIKRLASFALLTVSVLQGLNSTHEVLRIDHQTAVWFSNKGS